MEPHVHIEDEVVMPRVKVVYSIDIRTIKDNLNSFRLLAATYGIYALTAVMMVMFTMVVQLPTVPSARAPAPVPAPGPTPTPAQRQEVSKAKAAPFPTNGCPSVRASLLSLHSKENLTAVRLHSAFLFRAATAKARKSCTAGEVPTVGDVLACVLRNPRFYPPATPGGVVLSYLMLIVLVCITTKAAVECMTEERETRAPAHARIRRAEPRRSSTALVDLTVNLHIRKESQAAAMEHLASLGRGRPAIGTRPILLKRHRSFPALPPGTPTLSASPSRSPRHAPMGVGARRSTWSSAPGPGSLDGSRQLSVEATDGDSSPDMGGRRRAHIIRRH